METYRQGVAKSHDRLKSLTDNLYELVIRGPGRLRKMPSPLTFCAHGGEASIPNLAEGTGGGGTSSWEKPREDGTVFRYKRQTIWRMKYPQFNPNLQNIMPDFMIVDWGFVISVVLSFVAILFTFDTISGERERGTLALALSTGFQRHSDFLDQVHRYADEFRQFLIETDRADPDSPHVPFAREGMSEKPVHFEAIPKFEDQIAISVSLNSAVVDILLLVLFLVVLFAGAYLSFLRADVS